MRVSHCLDICQTPMLMLNNTNAGSVFSTSKSQPPSSSFDIQSVIKGAKDQGLTDPVEVPKFLQKEIVTGRALEVTSCEETIEGETITLLLTGQIY